MQLPKILPREDKKKTLNIVNSKQMKTFQVSSIRCNPSLDQYISQNSQLTTSASIFQDFLQRSKK